MYNIYLCNETGILNLFKHTALIKIAGICVVPATCGSVLRLAPQDAPAVLNKCNNYL